MNNNSINLEYNFEHLVNHSKFIYVQCTYIHTYRKSYICAYLERDVSIYIGTRINPQKSIHLQFIGYMHAITYFEKVLQVASNRWRFSFDFKFQFEIEN